MSGLLKGIGKVFKKVVKVAIKVLPYALAAAAVVFTGGAALGLLPTFAGAVGSVVGGLGLSAGLGTALTGSIVGAGFGAAAGGLIGGKKGMMSGMLMGGAAGALLPASMPGMGGVLKTGALGNTITSGALAPGGAISNTVAALPSEGVAATTGAGAGTGAAASSVLPTATSLAPTAPAGGGLFGMMNNNPLLASQLMGGVANAFTPSDQQERAKYDRKAGEAAYGGVYTRENAFSVPPAYGAPPNIAANQYYKPRATRWVWDASKSKVMEVPN